MPIPEITKDVHFADILDIAFVSFVLYTTFFWLKKSRAAFVGAGVLICAMIYLLAREFKLHLATSIMQGFFAVILVAVVIIFQEELKRFFEQIAVWSFNPKLRRKNKPSTARRESNILADTLMDMASEHVGALIVVCGNDEIGRHLYGGVDLGGVLSEPLLKSIFDPHSVGHDGAVVIEGDRITQFACHLPLSRELQKLKRGGTRHAAALGITELSDAMALVCSEERGVVSVSRGGQIREIREKSDLTHTIENFYKETFPSYRSGNLQDFFKKNLREKVTAVVVSMLLWFVFVHESVVVYKSFTVPVKTVGLPSGLILKEIKPDEVQIVFSAPRREYYFVDVKDIRLRVKLFNLLDAKRFGEDRYEVPVQASDLESPAGLNFESIVPKNIMFRVISTNPKPGIFQFPKLKPEGQNDAV